LRKKETDKNLATVAKLLPVVNHMASSKANNDQTSKNPASVQNSRQHAHTALARFLEKFYFFSLNPPDRKSSRRQNAKKLKKCSVE
jgi:hypothetical protein